MFRRWRRQHDREMQLVRAALDRLESQPSAATAVADLQKTISTFQQRSDSVGAARDTVVAHLWQKVIDQEHSVTAAMRQLVGLCALLRERLESQDRQQQELFEVIRVLANKLELPMPTAAGGERLIGGSFAAGPEPKRDVDVDLTTAGTAVEVKSRLDDDWVEGFEICEAVFDGGDPRYRLRRCADGVILPELVDAADTRRVDKSRELNATPHQQRHWSKL